jgi:AraC-like DNA-binding protein
MAPSSPATPVEEIFGFSLSRNRAGPQPRPHRHNEIEITTLDRGFVHYQFGAAQFVVPSGSFCARWGAIPHQRFKVTQLGVDLSLKIPLDLILRWQLPEDFVAALLNGAVFIDREAAPGCSDLALFERWFSYFSKDSPREFPTWAADPLCNIPGRLWSAEHQRIVLLEAEARLRRLALQGRILSTAASRCGDLGSEEDKAERMAAFIANHCTERVRVADVAATVGMHPNAAARLFRKERGMTLMGLLTLHRVWHAQKLLTTTQWKIDRIAAASGFATRNRFYAAYHKIVGCLPKAYREVIGSKSRI